jgi:hypothetical protein
MLLRNVDTESLGRRLILWYTDLSNIYDLCKQRSKRDGHEKSDWNIWSECLNVECRRRFMDITVVLYAIDVQHSS